MWFTLCCLVLLSNIILSVYTSILILARPAVTNYSGSKKWWRRGSSFWSGWHQLIGISWRRTARTKQRQRKDPCHYHLGWGGGFGAGGGVLMVFHHYLTYSSPCSFKLPCHYHLVGVGGPDGSSSLHVRFFNMFFQRYMSLPFRMGGGLGWVPMVLHHYMSYSSHVLSKIHVITF